VKATCSPRLFTCLIGHQWPLDDLRKARIFKYARLDSNQRLLAPEASTLSTELRARDAEIYRSDEARPTNEPVLSSGWERKWEHLVAFPVCLLRSSLAQLRRPRSAWAFVVPQG
jgi:hypothetical protein